MKALLILVMSTFGVDGAGTSASTTTVGFGTMALCEAAKVKLQGVQIVEQPLGMQKKAYGITIVRSACVITKEGP